MTQDERWNTNGSWFKVKGSRLILVQDSWLKINDPIRVQDSRIVVHGSR